MYEIQLTCGADKGQCRMKVSPAAVIFFLCVLTVTGCATTSNSPVTEDQDDSLQQLKQQESLYLDLLAKASDSNAGINDISRFVFLAGDLRQQNYASLSEALFHDYMKVFVTSPDKVVQLWKADSEAIATACYYLQGFYWFEDGSGIHLPYAPAASWPEFVQRYRNSLPEGFVQQW